MTYPNFLPKPEDLPEFSQPQPPKPAEDDKPPLPAVRHPQHNYDEAGDPIGAAFAPPPHVGTEQDEHLLNLPAVQATLDKHTHESPNDFAREDDEHTGSSHAPGKELVLRSTVEPPQDNKAEAEAPPSQTTEVARVPVKLVRYMSAVFSDVPREQRAAGTPGVNGPETQDSKREPLPLAAAEIAVRPKETAPAPAEKPAVPTTKDAPPAKPEPKEPTQPPEPPNEASRSDAPTVAQEKPTVQESAPAPEPAPTTPVTPSSPAGPERAEPTAENTAADVPPPVRPGDASEALKPQSTSEKHTPKDATSDPKRQQVLEGEVLVSADGRWVNPEGAPGPDQAPNTGENPYQGLTAAQVLQKLISAAAAAQFAAAQAPGPTPPPAERPQEQEPHTVGAQAASAFTTAPQGTGRRAYTPYSGPRPPRYANAQGYAPGSSMPRPAAHRNQQRGTRDAPEVTGVRPYITRDGQFRYPIPPSYARGVRNARRLARIQKIGSVAHTAAWLGVGSIGKVAASSVRLATSRIKGNDDVVKVGRTTYQVRISSRFNKRSRVVTVRALTPGMARFSARIRTATDNRWRPLGKKP